MKKFLIVLIAVIAIAAFSILVYYGFTRTRGIPVPIEGPKKLLQLEAPYIDKEIDFAKGIDADFWDTLSPQEIKLLYQVMVLPWPKAVTPAVAVKAFHNNKDIYFYLSWKDDSQDRLTGINKFSDACAIMFPLEKRPQTPTLMMGFLGKANIWHWKGVRDSEFWENQKNGNQAYADYHYPFEDKETLIVSKEAVKSAVNDLVSIRVTTVTAKEIQNVSGRGFWKDGAWQVVFSRAINTVAPDVDAAFDKGKKLCAFAVWNGAKGDRGGRKSISDWVELVVR